MARVASFQCFCALIVLSLLNEKVVECGFKFKSRPSSGGSKHSYPSSGGLSGHGGIGQSHGYPASGGLSGHGSAQSHGYPASGGLSGHGGVQSHGYPAGGGLSGHGTNAGHSYPSSNNGYGGGYPAQGGGLSGHNFNQQPSYPSTNQFHYRPSQGGPGYTYPVYSGPPPVYVTQIKKSNSRYSELLTGLTLLNLGMSGYALHHALTHTNDKSSSNQHNPNLICTFKIEDGRNIEMTRIPCDIANNILNNNNDTSTVQSLNVTTANESSATNQSIVVATDKIDNTTTTYDNKTETGVPDLNNNTTVASDTMSHVNVSEIVSVTTQSVSTNPDHNTTLIKDAASVEGPKVQVSPTMKCFVSRRKSSYDFVTKEVPCDLLVQISNSQAERLRSSSGSLPLTQLKCFSITAAVSILIIPSLLL